MSDVKKFWISFVLICASSITMHVLVFSKRQGRDQHHPPVYPDMIPTVAPPNATPVEGRVSALGTDRFYIIDAAGKQQMFLYGAAGRPQENDRVRVFYYDETPPIAEKWQKL